MERTRRAKADHVVCWRQGKKIVGSLHMMPHHLLFRYQWPQPSEQSQTSDPLPTDPPQSTPVKETWIGYPLIGSCNYRPSPPASHLPPQIRLRCRDFTFFAFHFDDDLQAREIFDTIRNSTCKIGHVDQLLAFSYNSNTEKACNGWDLYDPRKEFARMGISEKSVDKGWRISKINSKYEYSATYPSLLCVPSIVSDNTLKHTASFRSKTRIPVLTYLHALNDCTITRSAQPSAGIRGSRSPQDEKLVNAIFQTTRPSSKAPQLGASGSQQGQSTSDLTNMISETSDAVDGVETSTSGANNSEDSINIESLPTEGDTAQIVQIYGAQQTNMIIDARPSVNAMANQALGYGSENMEGYPTAKKLFLGIDNIHVMRKSVDDVIDALKDSDLTTLPPLYAKLEKSKWKHHIGMILSGALIISNTIAIQHSHVLIHCSDGWDRTSQLSALSQICLDPYYRTLEGFMVLIEKDWMSFGHMFRMRSGLLHHEKWFEMENERVNTTRNNLQPSSAEVPEGTGNAFENAIAKAQGFFRRKLDPNDDPDGEVPSTEGSPSKLSLPKKDEKMATKPKEMSPIFHQFLDATYQLLRQYPTRFEFNERFLRRLFYHLYSCQYGNFLYNNEKERVEAKAKQRTHSVWGYFLSKRHQFMNDQYDPTIDENDKDKTSLIEPRPHEVKWWHELFGRTESEMNGPVFSTISTFASDLIAGTASEGTDPSSSAELNTADGGSTASSQFGTMTLNSISTGRNSDVTSRFARMDNMTSDLTSTFSAASFNSTSNSQPEEATDTSWISGSLAGKRKDQVEVELR